MYLENWHAWDAVRARLLEHDRRFHLFAGGRHYGSYTKYHGARIALADDPHLEYGMIVKWVDTAFDRYERVLVDLHWKAEPRRPESTRQDRPEPASMADQDYLLIERLCFDYPAEWENRYGIVAEGALQGMYANIPQTRSRVAALEDMPNVYVLMVGPPRPNTIWYVKVVEAFYRFTRNAA